MSTAGLYETSGEWLYTIGCRATDVIPFAERTAPLAAVDSAHPQTMDLTLALVARLIGSFVGELLISLLSGDELQLQPSGIIGSLIGALVFTAVWQWYRRRSRGTHA
jgi:uncharacterized membrane protein YeaQ/YmgE (transglycosylase-associated protein family)